MRKVSIKSKSIGLQVLPLSIILFLSIWILQETFEQEREIESSKEQVLKAEALASLIHEPCRSHHRCK